MKLAQYRYVPTVEFETHVMRDIFFISRLVFFSVLNIIEHFLANRTQRVVIYGVATGQ